ncbi:MAG: hypothetical protein ACRD0F_02285, partial [Acidimicrobiales bacterium]
AQTVVSARGGVTVALPAGTLRLEGPGRLQVTGALAVQTGANPPAPRPKVGFGPGSYVLTLTPGPAGLAVDAVLEGPFE